MSRLIKYIICTDPKPLEIIAGIEATLFGIWLLLPFDTFGTIPSFSIMKAIMSEELWGGTLMAAGLSYILAVVIRNRLLQICLTITSLFLYLFISISFLLSNTPTTGIVTYLVFVIISSWATISLLSEQNRG